MKLFLYCFLLVLCPFLSQASIKLPALICNNMVLQQRSSVSLWGWADPGEEVRVLNSWSKAEVKSRANSKGEWILNIKTPKAGGPYFITISGQNKIQLTNVLIGEVWLCSGQSNMEFPLAKRDAWKTGVFNYEQEQSKADYSRIRMFTVQKASTAEEQKDVSGKWDVCTPDIAGDFSAIAYYFGKELLRGTGYPIGLIHSSWGGTPAESWVKQKVLDSDPDFRPRLERGQSFAKLYNGMIAPLTSYSIKGIIWYQGESNSPRPLQYRKLFPALINSWREDWKQELPFYFVQLAPHREKNPETREAQFLTYKSVSKTGIAVIADVGDSIDIHPRNKEVPGKRLALWALAKTYNKPNIVYSGPIYRSMKIEKNSIRLEFDFADGLYATDAALKEFTIAGSDQKFVPANVLIKGNTVLVSSPLISNPAAARFAWKNYSRPGLYNKGGLPASSFRTDDWVTVIR